ncbi:malto-oligosyltrehalose trehalohydrolase [Deinococcus deserti]|uniref:Malto-oligosyltrehalose trehalohydrolase n=1 Tax=Deinococcus deserti (strain DSM 17065 / CIP 109153 / LMG 22923 / VCD115) TaxID=546414 RepID=C1D308_DEIDV|nr:malto-oligosyltrehalose trehalohydrolase [Deinococcus deserti]ACO47797.1 putative 4-alpha-D-((1->4)-alpha-D-glucano)trehalose trehalohydrolase (Malto-oligosyltrehalose trehalohydrolase) [Deinococcus deserti VCD115]
MTRLSDPASVARPPALGASTGPEGTTFRLWSTQAQEAALLVYDGDHTSRRSLNAAGGGVFEGTFADLGPGTRYKFEVGGQAFPDPYARWLPEGVHGPAVVWESRYRARHRAPQRQRHELVIYEMHVGTFTPGGTYRAAAERLGHLQELGVTAIELLPLSAFPGQRGWGYDGVAHFAPFAPYGPPEDLQAFIDEAHGHGLLVLLDMVYNHFGPDGNYLGAYSPEYFNPEHQTPWGAAPDYTQPLMRQLALDSADHWLRTYGFDGFRLDATHEIVDTSEKHILAELAERTHALGQERGAPTYVFCEDDRNFPPLVQENGVDGIWTDDFHHQVRVVLTGEQDGYYAAYPPDVADLARCIERGWLYEGQPWPLSGKPRGRAADGLEAPAFVYCIQNHDQIGNRATGDRLQETAGDEGFLAASALLLFLPMTPLLFQGQEWMASTPFQFFSDFPGELGRQVTEGRLAEFAGFKGFGAHAVPDPQAESTYVHSTLNWAELEDVRHARVLEVYRRLLRLRREDPVMNHASRGELLAGSAGPVLWAERRLGDQRRLLVVNFGHEDMEAYESLPFSLDQAHELLRTSEAGSGIPARSAAIFALSGS